MLPTNTFGGKTSNSTGLYFTIYFITPIFYILMYKLDFIFICYYVIIFYDTIVI